MIMQRHSVVGALIVGLALSVAGSAAAAPDKADKADKADKDKPKKDGPRAVPELGAEGVAAAGVVVLAGAAMLASRRRRSAEV